MKKLLALTLAVIMFATMLAGCATNGGAGSNTGADAAASNDISVYLASTPETIDPAMNSSMDGANYIIHLMQGLYRYKWDTGAPELADAESVEVSEDGLTWTFKLRGDIKWTDGQDVTANDYVYAWRRLCNPDTGAPYGADLATFIKNGTAIINGEMTPEELGVTAIDEKTFEVVLEAPCSFFEQVAVFPVFYPVRQDIIEANGDSWWSSPETYVSNGPFMMESFTLDQDLVIVPNPDYYDRAKVVPTSITFAFLADENAALAALRAGEIDLANQAPPAEIAALKEEGLLNVKTQLGTYYLSFNTQVEPFTDPNVRKALTLAIDRTFISEVVMENTYGPAYAIVGPGFADADVSQDFREVGGDFIDTDFEANCELAKQALADAGFPNGEGFPVFEYTYNTADSHRLIAEALAATWEEVLGIECNLLNQEWNTFLEDRRKGNFEVTRNGWVADWKDASTMLQLFTSDSGNNDGKFSNQAFDDAITRSQTTDMTAHIQALHDAEQVLMEEWGCAPVLHYTQNFMVNKNVKNWNYTPVGYTLLYLTSKDAAE